MKTLYKTQRKGFQQPTCDTRKESMRQDNDDENVTTWLKPCVHYDRGCQLKCDECDEFYSCRFCHNIENDSINLVTPALSSNTTQNATSIIKYNGFITGGRRPPPHTFNQKAVKLVKCNRCLVEQPPSQRCQLCNLTFGKYFCAICNLFDNDTSKR